MFIELGISARHAHVTKETLEILFGSGSELHVLKDVKQPGQYAAEETIEVIGARGSFPKVRILGPLRSIDQVEMSMTDCIKLGVKAMVRESGDIKGSEGVILKGPKGEVTIKEGVIVAARHAHLSTATAKAEQIQDQSMVKAVVKGIRGVTFDNVLVRVSDAFVDELHLDVDEANACGAKNNDLIELIK